MKEFLRLQMRKIIYDEYNHIIIDSYEYLEFEDIILSQLVSENFIEEGFNIDSIRRHLKRNLEKMKN